MTVTIKGLFFLLYCIHDVAPFIQGTDIRITCSLPGVLPTWAKDSTVIANEGFATINTGSFPRISYDTDQKTLILTNLESGDAGTYTCSFAAGGSASFSVTVDVVAITGGDCPAEDSGFPFITSACATAADIYQEFKYIFVDHDNKQKKVCPTIEVTTNSTSCSAGTVQETAGYRYAKGESLCKKLKVYILGNLLHVTTQDTVHDSRNCTQQNYLIDPCCCDWEISGYALFAIAGIVLGIVIFLICFKFLQGDDCCVEINGSNEKCIYIFLLVLVILEFVGSLIGVIIIAVKPELPDGDVSGCCSCVGRIVFVVIMVVFIVEGLLLLIGLVVFPEKVMNLLRPLCCCCSCCCAEKGSGVNRDKKQNENGPNHDNTSL